MNEREYYFSNGFKGQFKKYIDSLELKEGSNVFVNGDNIDFEKIHEILKGVPVNLFLNGYFYDLDEDTVEEEYGYKIIKEYESSVKSEKKITPRSFSLVLDFAELDNIFIYRSYPEENYHFDLKSAYEEIKSSVDLSHKRIRSNLASGVISIDDLDKKTKEMILADEEELEKLILLKALDQQKDYLQEVRRRRRDNSFLRNDHYSLSSFYNMLNKEGVYLFFTNSKYLDSSISYKFTKDFKDIKLFDLSNGSSYLSEEEGSSPYPEEAYDIVLSGLREKRLHGRQNIEGYALSTFFSHDISSIHNKEKFNEYINFIEERYKEGKISDAEYHSVYKLREFYQYEGIEYEPISIVKTKLEDVKFFRIGEVSIEELNESTNFSRLLENQRKEEDLYKSRFSSYAPIPLHDGHIAMLLTSGLLNSYVGKGPNQHLIKGTTFKDIAEVREESRTKQVEVEAYNIKLIALDANGDFKTII